MSRIVVSLGYRAKTLSSKPVSRHSSFAISCGSLGIEHASDGRFYQALNQPIEVNDSLTFASQLVGELLGLEVKGRIHSILSVKKDGRASCANCVASTSFFAGPNDSVLEDLHCYCGATRAIIDGM